MREAFSHEESRKESENVSWLFQPCLATRLPGSHESAMKEFQKFHGRFALVPRWIAPETMKE